VGMAHARSCGDGSVLYVDLNVNFLVVTLYYKFVRCYRVSVVVGT
jgi:hypothetical protein